MERLYSLAGSVRSILFTCQRKNASSIDPLVRSALAETVQNDRHEWQEDWASVTAELERVSLALEKNIEREQFLDTRIRKYRKALAERSKDLAETPHEPDYEERKHCLDRDQEVLRGVQATHKEILIQCETMRRKMDELEKKRDQMARMDERLRTFVVDHCNLPSTQDEEDTPEITTDENVAPIVDKDESREVQDQEFSSFPPPTQQTEKTTS